jgi:hypothetical protein
MRSGCRVELVAMFAKQLEREKKRETDCDRDDAEMADMSRSTEGRLHSPRIGASNSWINAAGRSRGRQAPARL